MQNSKNSKRCCCTPKLKTSEKVNSLPPPKWWERQCCGEIGLRYFPEPFCCNRKCAVAESWSRRRNDHKQNPVPGVSAMKLWNYIREVCGNVSRPLCVETTVHIHSFNFTCSAPCLRKNCANFFLSELHQISTSFGNFWQKDGKEAKIMRGILNFHLT